MLDDRFEVGQLLGRGAHADVYRGEDRLLGRAVAIKAVRRDRLQRDGGGRLREQLLREARLVARLEHPSVIQVYDAGDEDGVPWIAMQLVTGGSLAERLELHGALDPEVVAAMLVQAASALDHAHAFGIVHRDLKPANVLLSGVDERGVQQVKLGDFGIARVLSEPRDAGETGDDQVIGTPAYMSPEQIAGGEVGARSDLFSLATVAYEALTGRRAFRSANFHELFIHISSAHFEPASRVRPELPAALDALFTRAFAPSPAERYATAGEFARDMQRTLMARSGGAATTDDPRELAGYELLEAAGGSLVSQVYKARRAADGNLVSLKIATEPRARVSLKHEIRVLARLDHPAIPKTVDSGESDGATFLAREWQEGGRRLPEVLASRRFELSEALRIAAELADALAHTHERGVLHLDLRPNSLLLRRDGGIVLGAFDRALERGARAQTELHSLGTPAYLSPELIRQDRELTAGADLYALGVLIFELVAGRVPFVDPSPYLTAMRHLNEPAPKLDAVASTAPPELVELVAQLLEKDPLARPATARAVADRLRAMIALPAGAPAGRSGGQVSWLAWSEVTVACVELDGFVAMAQNSSEARVAFLLERWYELVARTAGEFAGEVSSWVGDSVAVVFSEQKGEPLPAVRALRMLRALSVYVGEMNRSLDWEIAFTGGVHHDRVLAGSINTRLDGSPTLVGVAPLVAGRICAAAPSGCIAVSERVRADCTGAASLSGEFSFEPVAGVEIGGSAVFKVVAR